MAALSAAIPARPGFAVRRADDRTEGDLRRRLTVALALLWLLDAGLQYQPFMFSRAFPDQVISPAGEGNPAWVAAPNAWAADLMARHIVTWNALFATVQLAIAIGLLYRRTTKAALAVSIGWSLAVWWLGEGLGGALTGNASPLMGAPGAVILYAAVAVLLWPRTPADHGDLRDAGLSVGERGLLGRGGARLAWGLLWGYLAYLSLMPANRTASGLHDMVLGMQSGEPGWIQAIDRAGAAALDGRGSAIAIGLAATFALIATSAIATGRRATGFRRPAVVLAVMVSLLLWVIGQDFGGLATGSATDPNSGPALALLAVCFWPPVNRCGPAAESLRSR